MSLEQAIADHAGALRELAAAIRSTLPSIPLPIIRSPELDAATDKVIADAKKPAAPAASSPSGAKPQTTASKADAPVEVKKDEPAAPTYDDVKAKVLALSKDKGRDALVALLARHGVTKAPDLKESQYAAIIADVDAIFAGVYDPEASEQLA